MACSRSGQQDRPSEGKQRFKCIEGNLVECTDLYRLPYHPRKIQNKPKQTQTNKKTPPQTVHGFCSAKFHYQMHIAQSPLP